MPLGKKIPLFGRFWDSDRLLKLIEKRRELFYAELRLGAGGALDGNLFTNYENARFQGIASFEANAKTEDKDMYHRLMLNQEANAAITAALQVTQDFNVAKIRFEAYVDRVKDLAAEIPEKRSAESLVAQMDRERTAAEKALKAQQRAELDSIEARFQDAGFKRALMAANNIDPANMNEALVTETRNKFVRDLKATHVKQLEAFNKSADASTKNLHDAIQHEYEALNFLAMIRRMNDKNREMIDGMAARAGGHSVVTINGETEKVTLTNVKIQDLESFESVTGATITHKDGVFSLEMSALFRNYDQGRDQKPLVDMRLIAQGVRALGNDSITMKIEKFGSENMKLRRAQQAYEACIKEGYPTDKITIEIDGVKMKPEDLFKEKQTELSTLHTLAANKAKAATFNHRDAMNRMRQEGNNNEIANNPPPRATPAA